MADPRGFMTTPRKVAERRPVAERIHDWKEVYPGTPGRALLPIISEQAGRCMDCGIPFCHTGCPLGNLIPEWNDLVWRSDWDEALERLHATNNFPEFTGRLCPAPCETACVVGINRDPVTIKNVEVAIIDKAWDERRVKPQPAEWLTGKTVAVDRLRPGRARRRPAADPGGPHRRGLRAGRRTWWSDALRHPRVQDGEGGPRPPDPADEGRGHELPLRHRGRGQAHRSQLKERYDAVVLAIGSTIGRDLPVPGRELNGIHQAMEFLPQANRVARGRTPPRPDHRRGQARGDHRRRRHRRRLPGDRDPAGAESIVQLEIMPTPPDERPANQPWPTYPMIYRVSSAHEEAGDRVYSVSTSEFRGDEAGNVSSLILSEVEVRGRQAGRRSRAPSRRSRPSWCCWPWASSVRRSDTVVDQLGVALDPRGNIARDDNYATDVDGVFVCGDAGRGQSLIVWAIAEGRACAAGVDAFLSGSTKLPRPIAPDRPPDDGLTEPNSHFTPPTSASHPRQRV